VPASAVAGQRTAANHARKAIKSAKIQPLVSAAAQAYRQDAALTAAASALMSKIGGRF